VRDAERDGLTTAVRGLVRASWWCLLHCAVKSVPVLCVHLVIRSSVVVVVIVNYIEDALGNVLSSSVTSVCGVCVVCVVCMCFVRCVCVVCMCFVWCVCVVSVACVWCVCVLCVCCV